MHKYYHFCYEERVKLAKEGYSLRRIAKALDRGPSSIAREILRNQGKKGYRASQASKVSYERKHRKAQKMDCTLKEKVLDKLSLE